MITSTQYYEQSSQGKMSQIIIIPKAGKPQNKAYRPISLLPNLYKHFEKLFLQKLKPIQFGFQERHAIIIG